MKIGIAVVTTGHRPLPVYDTPASVQFVLLEDHQMRGPAWARNQALRLLEGSGCEHMFVFDDDFQPVGRMVERVCRELVEFGVRYAEVFAGRVTYQTAEALQLIGGYNEAHGRYGLERAGRTERARRAGLLCRFGGPTLAAMVEPVREPRPLLTVEEKEAHVAMTSGIYRREVMGELFYNYRGQNRG